MLQSAGNQQLRIGILVVVAALIGVGLWLAFGNSSNKKKHSTGESITSAIGPVALSTSELSEPGRDIVGQPIVLGRAEEGLPLRVLAPTNDRIFVRYLPKGVKAGAPGKKYLIIGDVSRSPDAYQALKKGAKGRGREGKERRHHLACGPRIRTASTSPGLSVPYEVEVYHPNARKARQDRRSPVQVTTVG